MILPTTPSPWQWAQYLFVPLEERWMRQMQVQTNKPISMPSSSIHSESLASDSSSSPKEHPTAIIGAVTNGRSNPFVMTFALGHLLILIVVGKMIMGSSKVFQRTRIDCRRCQSIDMDLWWSASQTCPVETSRRRHGSYLWQRTGIINLALGRLSLESNSREPVEWLELGRILQILTSRFERTFFLARPRLGVRAAVPDIGIVIRIIIVIKARSTALTDAHSGQNRSSTRRFARTGAGRCEQQLSHELEILFLPTPKSLVAAIMTTQKDRSNSDFSLVFWQSGEHLVFTLFSFFFRIRTITLSCPTLHFGI